MKPLKPLTRKPKLSGSIGRRNRSFGKHPTANRSRCRFLQPSILLGKTPTFWPLFSRLNVFLQKRGGLKLAVDRVHFLCTLHAWAVVSRPVTSTLLRSPALGHIFLKTGSPLRFMK